MNDKYSKVLECRWIGADCECCGTYNLYATNLDCGCQIDDELEIGTMVLCPYCNDEENYSY